MPATDTRQSGLTIDKFLMPAYFCGSRKSLTITLAAGEFCDVAGRGGGIVTGFCGAISVIWRVPAGGMNGAAIGVGIGILVGVGIL